MRKKRRNKNFYKLILVCFLGQFCFCEKKTQEQVSGTGTIETTEVVVSSQVSGRLMKIYVEEGSEVKEGEVLAEVEPTIYQLQLKQAESGLAMAEANLRVIEDNYRSILKLYKKGTSTQKQKEEIETRYKIAQAQYESAQTALNLAKQMLSYCQIIAPVSGIVTHKLVEAGELVGPGVGIATISQLEKVKLTIYVMEKELGRIKLGQRAEIKIDSYPDRVFLGKVIYISPEAEFTPKNIQTKDERVKLVYGVKIEIPNPDLSLKASMPADAIIKTEK